MGKNQSKIGALSLRVKSSSSDGKAKNDPQYGSLESLSTSVSLNSRVALLKSSNSLDEIHLREAAPRALDARGRYRLLEESIDFTSSDELFGLQSSPEQALRADPPCKVEEERDDTDPPCIPQDCLSPLQRIPRTGIDQVEELQRIPIVRSLNKLTPKEWDYLVQFICSSMEHSLQSVVVQRLEELRSYQRTPDSSSTGSSYNDDEQEQTVATHESSHRLHQHQQAKLTRTPSTTRPVSMPPTETFPWELDGAHQELWQESNTPVDRREHSSRRHHHHHHRSKRTSNSPPIDKSIDDNCPGLYQNRIRSSSSPNRVHWLKPDCVTQTHQYRSYSEPKTGQTVPQPDSSSPPPFENSFLTLGQLKDLGLALRQEPPQHKKENTSAISMQCWPSTNADGYRRPLRPKKRKGSTKRSGHRTTRTKENKVQQLEEMEPLGYFGPDLPDSGRDSPATNMAVADMEVRSPSPLEDETCYEVRHLHQHSHHHFHHVIHHSLSQPMDIQSMLAAPVSIEEISVGTQ